MVLKRISFGLILLLASCSESVVNDVSDGIESTHLSGEKFYNQRCVICHGTEGDLGISNASNLVESRLTDDQVEQIINFGKGAMPPFTHSIEADSTLIELIYHVKSLREKE